MKLSQEKRILAHLKKGKSITPLEALRRWGVMRLASRISDLRMKGYDIISTMIYRNGKSFCSYRLEV